QDRPKDPGLALRVRVLERDRELRGAGPARNDCAGGSLLVSLRGRPREGARAAAHEPERRGRHRRVPGPRQVAYARQRSAAFYSKLMAAEARKKTPRIARVPRSVPLASCCP